MDLARGNLAPTRVVRIADADAVLAIDGDEIVATRMRAPDGADEYTTDIVRVSARDGRELARTSFVFARDDRGFTDAFVALSPTGNVGVTRRGALVSLRDGAVRATLAFDEKRRRERVVFAAGGRSFLCARPSSPRAWQYTVHASDSGAASSTANGHEPIMIHADDDLARIACVGRSPGFGLKLWRPPQPKMTKVDVGERGEPFASPSVARWVLWEARRRLRVGEFTSSQVRMIDLPAWTVESGGRFVVGDRRFVYLVTTREGRLVAWTCDLDSGETLDEAPLEASIPASPLPRLDPTEAWVTYDASDGPHLWAIGTRTTHALGAGTLDGGWIGASSFWRWRADDDATVSVLFYDVPRP